MSLRERASFEAEIARDADLAREVERQKRFDATIRHRSKTPPVEQRWRRPDRPVAAYATDERTALHRSKHHVRTPSGRLWILLVTLAAIIAAPMVISRLMPGGPRYPRPWIPPQTLALVHADAIAVDYRPDWPYTDDDAFHNALRRELGTPLTFDAASPGTTLHGMSYGHVLTDDTTIAIIDHDGTMHLVVVDRSAARGDRRWSVPDGFEARERILGPLILIELAPTGAPSVLEHFSTP